MKLIRGVHISRMYAMLPRSDCGNFIRPLLGTVKKSCDSTWVKHGFHG